MGGPDANTDRLKQSISVVRASGGFPGNDISQHEIFMILLEVAVNLFTRTWFWIRSFTSARPTCREIVVLSLVRSQRQLTCERLNTPISRYYSHLVAARGRGSR